MSKKYCTFALQKLKQPEERIIMEAVRQVYLSIPKSDYHFVSTLSRKMGWTIHRERKCGLERAIDDVRAGRVYQAESVDDLMAQLEA